MAEVPQVFREERRRALAAMVRTVGRITAAEAAAELGTSTETIRKDLIALERQGILRRVHGGALHVASMTHEPLVAQRTVNLGEKRRIARAALHLIPHGGAIFVDAGSTTSLFAEMFPIRRLTVYTNTVSIAVTLAALSDVTVHTLGGRVRPTTFAEVGPQAMTAISKLHFDVAFVGTNSISKERGLCTPDPDEAEIKAAMIASADRSALLTDHTKFAHRSLVHYASIDALDLIITGNELAEQHRAALADIDVEVLYT